MPTYLYCLRNDPVSPPEGCAGVDGGRVRALDAGGLLAWVSDVADTRLAATLERVKAHDRVCSIALAVGDTPLPIRFGQTFSTDRATVQAIGSRRSVLADHLARVAGCVELRLVLPRQRSPHAPEKAPPVVDRPEEPRTAAVSGPGTSFLRRLAREGREDIAREAACEEARRAITVAAAAFIVEQRRCESRRGVSYFPLLVRRTDVESCRDAVHRALLASGTEPSLLGPFPPYSFAPDA